MDTRRGAGLQKFNPLFTDDHRPTRKDWDAQSWVTYHSTLARADLVRSQPDAMIESPLQNDMPTFVASHQAGGRPESPLPGPADVVGPPIGGQGRPLFGSHSSNIDRQFRSRDLLTQQNVDHGIIPQNCCLFIAVFILAFLTACAVISSIILSKLA